MHQDQSATISRPDLVRVMPEPAWVLQRPRQIDIPLIGDTWITNGVSQLLHDTQIDLTTPVLARYFHSVQGVLTRAGAERAAHFLAEFDPAFERLDVHAIRILRGQESIEHATTAAIHTFRRESSLESLALNGKLTASLLIPDVRIGDLIEISTTVYGSHPALEGKFTGWRAFNSFAPWRESHHRLRRPLTRRIAIRPFNDPPEPSITVANNIEDARWVMVGQERRIAEDCIPSWQIQVPALQLSEAESWNQVARLFAPLYDDTNIPDTLATDIDRIANAYQNAAERAVEWLRFVQRTLRYFALSLDEGGLVPRPIAEIWGSRFGDCKDATCLYLAGARRMGLDVCAALISTTHGQALNDFLPSPSAFNHCIVGLRLNGKSYWLDPTMQTQSGSLDQIAPLHAGWALPLRPEAMALEALGNATPLHVLNWEEDIEFGPRRDSPAKLRRTVEHFYWSADGLRYRLANEGTNECALRMLMEARETWPGVTETAPIQIDDDPTENRLSITLNYEIPNCWESAKTGKKLGFKSVDLSIRRELQAIKSAQRHAAIYLARPRKMTRIVRMSMPRKWTGSGWSHHFETPGLSYAASLNIDGRRIRHSKELIIDQWLLPAEDITTYGEVTAKLNENMLAIWARERWGNIYPIAGGWGNKARHMFGQTRIVIFVIWILAMLANTLLRHQ